MAFITIAGQNQIAKKQGDNVTLNIASFVLANVPDLGSEPETRIESIPNGNVVDQLVVTRSGYVNTNQVVYSLVMGSDIGNYSFNWVGLVDDEGVLIAVTYIPLTPKTKNDGGVPGNTITRNFLLAYTGIQQTTAITVPAETWQIDFSARLSGIDERERLANFDIYGHEGFLGDGWKVTGSAGTYSVAAGVGYVGGIRAKNIAPQEITTATFPNEIWLNVSLQGDISDMSAVSEFVIDTGPFADYVDGNGITHYLTKIADIDAEGEVTEARSVFESMSKHIDEEDPHPQYLKKEENAEQLKALKQIPIYPEILTDSKVFQMDLVGSDFTVAAGQEIRMRGWNDISTDDLDRSFSIDISKTYHVRFSVESGVYLKAVDDIAYNPDSLDESDRSFDTTYDDVLLARIDGSVVTALINSSAAFGFTYDGMPNSADSALSGNDYTGAFELSLNWSRSPVSDSIEIKGHFTTGSVWNDLMSTTVMLTRERAELCPVVFDKTYILNRYECRLPVAHANGANLSSASEPIADLRMFEKIVRVYGY
jgi:hypothetical protein